MSYRQLKAHFRTGEEPFARAVYLRMHEVEKKDERYKYYTKSLNLLLDLLMDLAVSGKIDLGVDK